MCDIDEKINNNYLNIIDYHHYLQLALLNFNYLINCFINNCYRFNHALLFNCCVLPFFHTFMPMPCGI